MVAGAPTFAVLYVIIRRVTKRKLKEKNIVIFLKLYGGSNE